MGTYIDADYLREVVGDEALLDVLSHRFRGEIDLDDAESDVVAAINRAIAVAEGEADAKLGRRFTSAQLAGLDDAGHGEFVKDAVARIALYKLAPLALPISDEIKSAYDRACTTLKEIGKGELAAGRQDPHPPPQHTQVIDTLAERGLAGLRRV